MSDNKPSKNGKYIDSETWDALKAAGYSEEELLNDQPEGPMIFSYTRAQAIEDGVLIDVTHLARNEGFRIPVAVTCGVWEKMTPQMPPPFKPENVTPTLIVGLLRKLRRAIRHAEGPTDRIVLHDMGMWASCGPGDDAEPVITIMLDGED